VRRLAWEPPAEITVASVGAALRGYGARGWQVSLVGAPLAGALPAQE
jgi:ribonuclease D